MSGDRPGKMAVPLPGFDERGLFARFVELILRVSELNVADVRNCGAVDIEAMVPQET